MTQSNNGQASRKALCLATLGALLGTSTLLTAPVLADGHAGMAFSRIATFPVLENLPATRDAEGETVAEIITASEDGMTLIYTDSEQEALGFIDITSPTSPVAAGFVPLPGEPTSVTVSDGIALVAVNESEDFVNVAGDLIAVDIASQDIVATCPLGGQPDSIDADGDLVAIAIENERDEDLNDGVIPQLPAGNVTLLDLADGVPQCDTLRVVDVTGLADTAGSDPEPEFLDVAGGKIVVSLQENNHMAVIDAVSGEVMSHFSAGAVDLEMIDTEEEGVIRPVETINGLVREPDAVKWLDDTHFVTANEGDYLGGSRGFTIFSETGDVIFDSASDLEHLAIRLGHYPEERSGNKGAEPEGIEVATFVDHPMIFVGLERSGLIAVYNAENPSAPEFMQAVPAGIGPEGLLAIPSRELLVVANEVDLREDNGPGSSVMIYRLEDGAPAYPTIQSADQGGAPIPFAALSGLAAHPDEASTLFAVSDSFLTEAAIYQIDASSMPGTITNRMVVSMDGAAVENLDLEGVAVAADGGFWLASEGHPERDRPNQIIKTDPMGNVEAMIALPEELIGGWARFGLEGVTVDGDMVWVAQQRSWGDDDAGMVKLMGYNTVGGEWSAVSYPLDTPERGWVGLSEITAIGDGRFLIVERDNQIGANAAVKRLYLVDMSGVEPGVSAVDAPTIDKVLVRDLMADLESANGYVLDKIEGFTLAADGTAYILTDNDGVDDHSGETLFISLGELNI
ncbi:MAG: esterase-like activity of phytase family protein [Pseudomonadota bacterium]